MELEGKNLKINVTGQVPLVYTVSYHCFPYRKFELLFYSHHGGGTQCGTVASGSDCPGSLLFASRMPLNSLSVFSAHQFSLL